MPRVSVILTSWNKPAFLQEAINSVLAQTYRDFELLILDDNSDDPAIAPILDRYRKHPKCRVWESDVSPADRRLKVRYAVLANVGLQMATGWYVTYLCDDDLYLPHRLERMVERLDRVDCAVVYGAQRLVQDGREIGMRAATEILTDAYCKVDHSSVMHVKGVAEYVKGWDESPEYWRIADAMFWRRMNNAGYAFHPIPEALDIHRFHAASVSARLDLTGQPV